MFLLVHETYLYTAVQSQNAVSNYFTSKQILPFGFTEQYSDTCPYYLESCFVG